jgi:hypothetical protein
VSFAPLPSFSPSTSRVEWWLIGPFYASSGELLHCHPWWVPLRSFSGRAKGLSIFALFPSISPCLYLLQSWSLGLSPRAPVSSLHCRPWRVLHRAFLGRANRMIVIAVASALSWYHPFVEPWPVEPGRAMPVSSRRHPWRSRRLPSQLRPVAD